MNDRISVPTIDNIQFINLQPDDINPLAQRGIVKVFYLGQNRNGSSINKETGNEMSKTLRGCPIVGWYRKEKEDFGDHGEQITINGDGVTFEKLTKPYGFIPTDAKIWWQFFEDADEWGNTVVREYLVAECLLWAGQFPECREVLENHNPQSMELDPETLKGHWATDNNSGLEFFIINDAIFSTLCILGEDVEPCFEGASFLESPETNSAFSKDSSFVKDLFTMMQEIRYALNNNKGGVSMEENKTPVAGQEVVTQETEQQTAPTEQVVENSLAEQDKNNELDSTENENNTGEFKKDTEEEEDDKDKDKDDNDEDEEDGQDKKKPSGKNSLEADDVNIESLQKSFNELQEKFTLLEKENSSLLAFKKEIEDKQKDELIESFYMLSDEDKKDIIANKANYTLDDIEKELSVICVRKKVNFNATEDNDKNATVPTVFNLDSHQADDIPAWLKCVEDVRKHND